jgi:hypothetical protein
MISLAWPILETSTHGVVPILEASARCHLLLVGTKNTKVTCLFNCQLLLLDAGEVA